MRRFLGVVALLLLGAVAVYGAFDFIFPEQFTAAALSAGRSYAGLQRKETEIPGFKVVYLDGGQGRPLLLLHGFGADKDNWIKVAPYLTPRYRVIAVDLPGFGESGRPSPGQCRIEDQLTYVSQIAAALGLQRFDLGGNSMGGWIAAAYAAAHPDQVSSLWLLAPAGVSTADTSELGDIVKSGGHVPLITRTPQEYRQLVDFVFVHPPYLPHAMLKVMSDRQAQNYEFDQQVFAELRNGPPLEPKLKDLATPALVVWGDHDRALHYSGADVLQHLMPNAQVQIMPDVGHVPMLEAPAAVAARYINFRESLSGR
ncbi:MAG: alpha/beta fold hydrolase [Nevskia sp.]|nr:alpha/beta fold hydrolase [Nevskia sp.]